MSIEFTPFPKIPRLNRTITVTEKLDGTNAAVVIVEVPFGQGVFPDPNRIALVAFEAPCAEDYPDFEYHVYAQSRNRFIKPGDDNYGFAAWVKKNAETLVATLGAGTHFGEWYGAGIQRGYGILGKRFALFNTDRWGHLTDASPIPELGVVPVLYQGVYDNSEINLALALLHFDGSVASPDFMRPEGIVIWHHAARTSYKVTLEGDAAPKSQEVAA